MYHDEKCEYDWDQEPNKRLLIEVSIVDDAPATEGPRLIAKSLKSEYKQTICVHHFCEIIEIGANNNTLKYYNSS